MTPLRAGIIGAVLLVLFSYAVYTKFANPFASKFTVHAMFSSANGLRPDSVVRIAGINVGRVSSVNALSGCRGTSGCHAADVTMQIDGSGLPIHEDATFNIRPRIFLEGNFFVDLHPGSPSTPSAPDGYTFPIQAGTEPVQLDQVLTSLPQDTRSNLQTLLQQYGYAINTSGASYNQSIDYWLPAYKYSSIVAQDALGTQPHDLSNFVDKGGRVAAAFDTHPQNLKNLVTDFNTTAGAFARQSVALQQAVADLPTTLATAIPAFNALNNAFPPLRTLARTLTPGVVSSGPAIDASLPFIAQLRLLVQPSELRGLTSDLAVTVPALARLTRGTIPLMSQGVRPASSCVATVIHPWSVLSIHDPNFSSSEFPPRQAYVEGVDYLPGLAGESRLFDANGPVVRVGLTAGTLTYSLAPNAFGQALAPLGGVQPTAPPGKQRPPLQETVPCETQAPITTLDDAPIRSLTPVAGGNGTVIGNLLGGVTSLLPAKDRVRAGQPATTTTSPHR